MRTRFFLHLFAALLAFLSNAYAISAETKRTKDPKPPADQITPEQERLAAIKGVAEFGESMRISDPSYSSKEERILAAIPIIKGNFPPSMWEMQVRFLYAALTEIDKKAELKDAKAILGKYYKDEASKAPNNPFQLSLESRRTATDRRMHELETMLHEKRIDDVEHAARMLSVAMIYFPSDPQLIPHRQYKLDIALQLARGEIDRDTYDMLWDSKKKQLLGEIDQTHRANQAREEQQRQAARSQTISNMLSGAANALRNTANTMPAQPITCQTIANITTCR